MHTPYPVDYPEVSWRVVALETPRVWRHCAACNQTCRFASSDLFRLNAQQRQVDVWLLYRCTGCDATWKCPIFTRCTPEAIGADLYARCQHNDRATAWMYAFDLRGLRRLGVRVDAAVPVGVERRVRPGASKPPGGQKIVLELPYPCALRLDRLLAGELGVTRASLWREFAHGRLQVWPFVHNALRKPIRNGQIIVLPGDLQERELAEF